jgi:TrmH family RNA methyltransferase
VLKARPQDISTAFETAGVPVYGADVKGEKFVTELPAKRPIAVAFGHETQGLHPDVARGLAGTFRIPMKNGMDSLNVASAAVVTLYELGRSNIAGK